MLDTFAMAKQLTGEYRKVFELADMYCTGSSIGEKIRNERMMDLYDMLMAAEADGKSVEKIVGMDIEKFCKGFFVDDRHKLIEVAIRGYNIARILFVLSIIDYFLAEDGAFFQTQVNVFPVVSGLIIGCILTVIYKFVLQPIVFKNKKMNPTLHSFIILAIFVVAIVIHCIIGADVKIYLNNLFVFLISGGYIFIYLVVRSIWRIRTYGKAFGVHKEEKQLEKEFNRELDKKETLQINAEVMAKEFAKKNAKRRKKGELELTQAEYAAMVRKREKYSSTWILLIILAIILVPTVWEMINNSFTEGLMYGLILIVIEFFIWRFFSRISKDTTEAKLKILDECELQGVTVEEYYKNMKENTIEE